MAADKESRATIVVIHRYPMVRRGIRATIEAETKSRIVGESGDPDEGLELVRSTRPGILIMGMHFPDRTGFDLVRDVSKRWPGLRVLIHCDAPIADFPERCLRAGAHGYVAMSEPIGSFVQAIAKIERGQIYLSDEHSTALLLRLAHQEAPVPRLPVERLSEGELGVLSFIARGMSNGEIARALHRSVKTVETYRTRIKRKVGVTNATALAQFAVTHLDPNGLAKVVERAEQKERIDSDA